MRAIPRRLLAVCLAAGPAASAAPLFVPALSLERTLGILSTALGAESNAFTAPAIEEPVVHAAPPAPLPRLGSGPVVNPPVALFQRVLIAASALAVSLGFIPRVHLYRARWKALNLRVPLN